VSTSTGWRTRSLASRGTPLVEIQSRLPESQLNTLELTTPGGRPKGNACVSFGYTCGFRHARPSGKIATFGILSTETLLNLRRFLSGGTGISAHTSRTSQLSRSQRKLHLFSCVPCTKRSSLLSVVVLFEWIWEWRLGRSSCPGHSRLRSA